jgi:Mce-associated membrane protein
VTAPQDTDVTEGEEPVATGTEPDAIEAHEEPAEEAKDEAADVEPAGSDRKPSVMGRVRTGAARHWIAILLTIALLAAAAVTAWMFFGVYRQDRQTDASAIQSAINAASDGTVAILSYAPDTLDKDFSNAKSKLTGNFLSYYTQFTDQIVAPAAKEKAVKTQASVVRAAVSEIHPDSAVVLVFINQTTESKDRPDASFINSAVRVTLQKVNNGWLISAFDPV